MVRRHIIGVAVLAAILFATPRTAGAQPIGLFAKIAFDPSIGGTMHTSGSGIVNGVALSVSEQSWTDTHTQQSPSPPGFGRTRRIGPGGFDTAAPADTTAIGTAGRPRYPAPSSICTSTGDSRADSAPADAPVPTEQR